MPHTLRISFTCVTSALNTLRTRLVGGVMTSSVYSSIVEWNGEPLLNSFSADGISPTAVVYVLVPCTTIIKDSSP